MLDKLRKLFRGKPEPVRLICMRLTDMQLTHPEQVTHLCPRCGASVGIYPSGQRVLKTYPGNVEIMCQKCAIPLQPGDYWAPAPGALDEARQSRKRSF